MKSLDLNLNQVIEETNILREMTRENYKLSKGTLIPLHVLDGLDLLENDSVDCIITSPPYYRLRKNNTKVKWNNCKYSIPPSDFAISGINCINELGQESSVDHYLHHLKMVFLKCRRVLKESGNLFVVIDDTEENGDLMIPERFAIMMKDDLGWIRKRDIIWRENNKLPKGGAAKNKKVVKDYEHIYHFVKDFNKSYFKQLYEPYSKITIKEFETFYSSPGLKDYKKHGIQNPSKVKANIINKHKQRKFAPLGGINKYHDNTSISGNQLASSNEFNPNNNEGRLLRGIWEMMDSDHIILLKKEQTLFVPNYRVKNSKPLETVDTNIGAFPVEPVEEKIITINHDCLPKEILHFSAFPRKLVERLIDLGCPENGTILDPFMGSGSTAVIAEQKNLPWIGIEINEEYIKAVKIRLERGK